MLGSAGGGLVNDGGKPRAAALGNDDAVCARTFCGADDSAQIVRIGQPVAQQQKRLLAARTRNLQQIGDRHVFMRRSLCDHALMHAGFAHRIQLAAVTLHNDRARLLRHRADIRHASAHVRRDKQLIHGFARAQQLGDCISALVQSGLLLLVRLSFPSIVLSHSHSSMFGF